MTVNPARHGPFAGHLAPHGISAYAAATGDDTASAVAGCAVPATFPVILVFAAVERARGDVPPEAWKRCGEHEIVLHRPLEPGEALTTWSRISGMRTSRAGTRVAVHLGQLDCDGLPAVEQWWTMVLLGLDGLPDLGTMPAEHRFPGSARANGLGSTTFHVDAKAARAAGFDFMFAHGVCTMAICTHRLLALLGVDDPGRVSRVAVRFAFPTPLGCDLTVSAYGIDERSFAFEAAADGVDTITHGRLELRT